MTRSRSTSTRATRETWAWPIFSAARALTRRQSRRPQRRGSGSRRARSPQVVKNGKIEELEQQRFASKIELRAHLGKSCGQDERRRQPCRSVGLVVGLDRTRVQHIVDVDTHLSAGPAKLQDLGHAEVDLVDPIAVQRA